MPGRKRKQELRPGPPAAELEVHQLISISRSFRTRLGFADPFLADFSTCRLLAQKMNDHRDLERDPGQAVRASQLYALSLIEEVLRYVLHLFLEQMNPKLFQDILEWSSSRREAMEAALQESIQEFPPLSLYRQPSARSAFLNEHSRGLANRHLLLRELILLWLAKRNPAYAPYAEAFDDTRLEDRTSYRALVASLLEFFDSQPFFGPDHQNLLDMLHSPAVASPGSLPGQLEYILNRWGSLLGKYLERFLRGLDFLKEEEKLRLPTAGETREYSFDQEPEGERFSADREWMPRVVMLAKSTLVWLYQLSRKHGRAISRLDQIPDEELDAIARRGFTALWLIGLWERSRASRRIKRICGNPEAEASAYSLREYRVAGELGGEEALANLKARCLQRGLRLASDMVPNHMGLDSPWVFERPDWFIGLDHPPFPSYSFSGEDLGEDPRCGIFLEDHYYDRSDAGVVFKWVQRASGRVRYLYHGNDGTHLPWNDTAQLNYLKAEVREAVIRAILEVSRLFPIIRFDAAMTLTRRHFQRLWFPPPGSGGDIPSRSEHGLSQAQFNRLMPEEFWRQVVDRVAQENPDTLLLAEAFWLLEGYFVRTLGMHRVYNSAFMNMLKAEENRKYRALIKNTLEFDPEILRRYVNFMNNPDEETAAVQFGKGDKYFGVCVMLATLPGLPLFGHGQVEGFQEKYGMEYRRAYWDEQPDPELVQRHERLIFPLLRKRALFAGVEQFLLYDLLSADGEVNENVFVYSNRRGCEAALVLYNNRYAEASGRVRLSVPRRSRRPDGSRALQQRHLAEALGLPSGGGGYCLFHERVGGLEYVRTAARLWEEGLYVALGAYQAQVFEDFRTVWEDASHPYGELEVLLQGRGTPAVGSSLRDVLLKPVRESFAELYAAPLVRRLLELGLSPARDGSPGGRGLETLLEGLAGKLDRLLEAGRDFRERIRGGEELGAAAKEAAGPSRRAELLAGLERGFAAALDLDREAPARLLPALREAEPAETFRWSLLSARAVVTAAGRILLSEADRRAGLTLAGEWGLEAPLSKAWLELGLSAEEAGAAWRLLQVLIQLEVAGELDLYEAAQKPEPRSFLQVHSHQGSLWFKKEPFLALLWWLLELGMIPGPEPAATARGWMEAAEKAGYRLERFLELGARMG